MSNKIIFLDVDGVLNSNDWFQSQEYRKRRDFYNAKYKDAIKRAANNEITEEEKEQYRAVLKGTQIDPAALLELNRVIEAVNPKIVLSSTWRLADFTRDAVAQAGILGYDERFFGVTRRSRGGEVRGDEILDWVIENGFTGKFIMLDDDGDAGQVKENLVQTSFMHGLTRKEGDEIIRRLT